MTGRIDIGSVNVIVAQMLVQHATFAIWKWEKILKEGRARKKKTNVSSLRSSQSRQLSDGIIWICFANICIVWNSKSINYLLCIYNFFFSSDIFIHIFCVWMELTCLTAFDSWRWNWTFFFKKCCQGLELMKIN